LFEVEVMLEEVWLVEAMLVGLSVFEMWLIGLIDVLVVIDGS
jgi:hypothetical protein